MAAAQVLMPQPAGRLTRKAPLAPLTWFRTGGAADWLFEPKDEADLAAFLAALDPQVPVMALGLGSNLIVRDGGVEGVVVRLGKAFAGVAVEGLEVTAGGGAAGIAVASAARDAGVGGLAFLRGIPGTVGGFVRMNAGAYGTEVADVLVACTLIDRRGARRVLARDAIGFSYRHCDLPADSIVVSATLAGVADRPAAIQADMDRIQAAREASQPLRTRTGGSTFRNPEGAKAWELIDRAGCRGMRLGGAQVSEKHANFLINTGDATSADIEALGEAVRARVAAATGVQLEWEIARVGRA
ncbi:MAG: UDP-N-acetylmuramate dehydrogenase [Sphingomonadaceae bacterium]